MNSLKLIRNKWFLLIFSFFFWGIICISFQWVYKKELLLRSLYKSTKSPDTLQVMILYSNMMKSIPDRHELKPWYFLANILIKAEKKKEAIKVLSKLIKIAPEDREVRLWLAIELHNQKRYREAEKHFAMLLKEKPGNAVLLSGR